MSFPKGVVAVVCAALAAGCGFLKLPPVIIVDSRTALENQVLGAHEPLAGDLLLAASLPPLARQVWERAREEPPGTPEEHSRRIEARERFVRAIESQESHRDDLIQARRSGWVGESAGGEVHVFEERIAALDARARARAQALAAQENRDRADLLDAVMALSSGISASERPELQKIFSKQYQERLLPGDWIERSDGKWEQLPARKEAAP